MPSSTPSGLCRRAQRCEPVAEEQSPLRRAWELTYLDPAAALAGARAQTTAAGGDAAEAWALVALLEARHTDTRAATAALASARLAYAAPIAHLNAASGLSLCDEIQAMLLRRAGDVEASARLQDEIDARAGVERDAMHRFVAHNSRAMTAKLLGHPDTWLRHFHAAWDAARQTGWAGPNIVASANLGGCHHDLYNLEDARALSEQALAAAQAAGATEAVFAAAANLISIHYAAGDLARSRAVAGLLQAHPGFDLRSHENRYTLPLALGHLAGGENDTALALLRQAEASVKSDAQVEVLVFWAWLMARCELARGDTSAALAVAEAALRAHTHKSAARRNYDLMSLHRALSDAAEQSADFGKALCHLREANALYEHLVGRSARARCIALQISHQLGEVQRERDVAVDGRRSAEDDQRRLSELNMALQAQVAETEMLHTRLREQALRDPLTGLHNRRYLFEVTPGLLERARRQAAPLCVALLDLDHFKLLNDTCGHAAGDLVLQRFAMLLTETLRKSDIICRHGGEEFVAVMPDIGADDAQAVLARLLQAFTQMQLELGRRRLPRGSFSAGIAVFAQHGNTLEQLLSRADRALYAAKSHGRARIEQVARTGFATLV